MTTTHTPGPWARDAASGLKCDVRAASGRKVALCWGLTDGDPYRPAYRAECDANAHLIAAAPELLEALREACVAHHSANGTKPPESWLLAIAKAEGRT